MKNSEFKPHSSFQERLNKILCPEEDATGVCGFQLSEDQRNRVRICFILHLQISFPFIN